MLKQDVATNLLYNLPHPSSPLKNLNPASEKNFKRKKITCCKTNKQKLGVPADQQITACLLLVFLLLFRLNCFTSLRLNFFQIKRRLD